jgi:hypothetical protein
MSSLSILCPNGKFNGHLVHFVVIVWSFGIFFPVSVFCSEKNLATLVLGRYLGHFLGNFASSTENAWWGNSGYEISTFGIR